MSINGIAAACALAVAAIGVVGCGSGSSSASAATAGFTTSCNVTGRQEQAVEFKVSVAAAQAAEVTDVDVEFLANGAPLSTQGFTDSDGGVGILMSKAYLSAGDTPTYMSSGKTETFTADPEQGSVFVNAEYNSFPTMPTSCEVIAVATPSNPGNF